MYTLHFLTLVDYVVVSWCNLDFTTNILIEIIIELIAFTKYSSLNQTKNTKLFAYYLLYCT